MMKNFILAFISFFYCILSARADVCYEITEETAATAVKLIENQKEVYGYCSICMDAAPKVIPVNNIKFDKSLYINGSAVDLANIYYKNGSKYFNLGVASNCIKDGEYNIHKELDTLPTIHRTLEGDKDFSQNKAKKIFEACAAQLPNKDNLTTEDMVERSKTLNDCLATAIHREIMQAFPSEEQTKMLEALNQARKSIFDLYQGIYSQNRYCQNNCGSASNIFPYSDEGRLLNEILVQLIDINVKKGY